MKKIIGIGAYLAISFLNVGAYNANLRASFHRLAEDPRHARQDFAVSILFGLAPPSIIIAPFLTGLYEDGWSLNYHPFPCDQDPKIWCGKGET